MILNIKPETYVTATPARITSHITAMAGAHNIFKIVLITKPPFLIHIVHHSMYNGKAVEPLPQNFFIVWIV